MVGDAVAKKRSFVDPVPLIGVNCWGAVANNHELVHKEVAFLKYFVLDFIFNPFTGFEFKQIIELCR